MFGRMSLGGACVAGLVCGAILGGCVVVVHDSDGDWDWDESSHSKPRMGVHLAEPGRALSEQLKIDRHETTVITDVVSGSPADRAGLQKYDVVTRIDGDTDADSSDLRRAIRSSNYGDTIILTIIREGQTIDVPVVLEKPSDKPYGYAG